MQQLVLELAAPEPPSFANFLPGGNAEPLAALRRASRGEGGGETAWVLWGGRGVGKTHLLRAAVAETCGRGEAATFIGDPGGLGTQDPEWLATRALVAVDDIDRAGPEAQALAFTVFNAIKSRGGCLLVASAVPPAAMPLREDLRTRLGEGLVYEIVPLADAEKPAALAAYARQRGFRLADDVVAYLLTHGPRDMGWLLAALGTLDRLTLSLKRPLTVPVLRDWLQSQARGRPGRPG